MAQCDLWFPEADIPLGYGQTGRPPVLVMMSGYSRVIAARMLPSRTTGDLIDGHWRLLSAWGAVPKTLVWDHEAGVGRDRLTAEFAAFAGLLATKIHLCRPRFRRRPRRTLWLDQPRSAGQAVQAAKCAINDPTLAEPAHICSNAATFQSLITLPETRERLDYLTGRGLQSVGETERDLGRAVGEFRR
ncbi:hypothetical protein [Streptomyces sp. NPDC049915]|uniref:hypothetical protein n=1 Tax=Streptomyces sp. NPDC049915 TaxID=3155510 RepID=UPI003443561E